MSDANVSNELKKIPLPNTPFPIAQALKEINVPSSQISYGLTLYCNSFNYAQVFKEFKIFPVARSPNELTLNNISFSVLKELNMFPLVLKELNMFPLTRSPMG